MRMIEAVKSCHRYTKLSPLHKLSPLCKAVVASRFVSLPGLTSCWNPESGDILSRRRGSCVSGHGMLQTKILIGFSAYHGKNLERKHIAP